MAVDDINNSGILDDAKFELKMEDGMNTTEAAINATQKLIQTHKVLAIFGPSSQAQALVSVPLVAVANNEIRRKKFKELGVEIVLDEMTLATDTDFSPVISKIMQARPDALVVDCTPPAEELLIRQTKQAGYKGLFLNGPTGVPTSRIKAVPDVYEGGINVVGWLPDMPGASEKARDFTKRYRDRFGFDPDMYSAGIYDSVWMLAHAIKQAGSTTDTEAIRKALANLEIEGVQGKLKFKENRTLNSTAVIYQVKDGKQVPFPK